MMSMNNAAVSKETLEQFDELVEKSGMQVNDLLKILAKAYNFSLREEIISELNMQHKNYWDSFTS
jgi:hypothetical protein